MPLHQNGFVSATEMMGALMDTFHLEPVSDASGPQWKVVEILHSHAKQSGANLQPGITGITLVIPVIPGITVPGITVNGVIFQVRFEHGN